uniref:Double-stranded RNA binding motif-containing protein n=1 Tax=Marseillevirus LCMAC101 TaxID=2506602 RepID=A0A481YRB6_9VIRU|nr:MAG: double-stranded RNA binding motif-containing protein [Marseillevirus LCMAC101]
MSEKNKLQEFFQKKSLPLPTYYTNKVGGTDNNPKWVCIIKLFNGEMIYSNPSSGKKACEMEAAAKALAMISSHDLNCKNEKYRFDIDFSVIILVDGENQPIIPIKFVTEVHTSASLIVYISKGHPIKPKLEENDIRIVEVDSTRKDAVDLAIVMDSVRLHFDHIIVVTNDHFGATLVELLNKEFGHLTGQMSNRVTGILPGSSSGHLVRNYEELLNILEELSSSNI